MHRFHIHIFHFRIPFFRIFYSTAFTLFTLLLTGLLLITPGDHILQSFHHNQLYHIIIVGAVWVLTFFIALFVYAGRLFRTRSALANIPREWNLNGHGRGSPGVGLGMGLGVGRVVREGLERSAIVAFESRPRDLRGQEEQVPQHIVPVRKKRKRRRAKGIYNEEKQEEGTQEDERQESLAASNNNNNAEAVPVWGVIAHPGWASPESPDLPSLHFEPVIAELGHLIEAKAVSLAPVDPLWQEELTQEGMGPEGETSPDPLVLMLLQRPVAMGLREYIAQLTSLGMIMTVDLCAEFIELYERARFSEEPLKETEFRHLMAMFAEILRNMVPLPRATVDELHAAEAAETRSEDSAFDEADGRSMDSEGTTRRLPRPQLDSSQSSLGSNSSTHVTAPSRQDTARNVSLRTGTSRYTTAPSDHRQRLEDSTASLGKSSTHSLRKMSSRGSVGTRSMLSSAGSVIRLADARSSLDLPYAYVGSSEERL